MTMTVGVMLRTIRRDSDDYARRRIGAENESDRAEALPDVVRLRPPCPLAQHPNPIGPNIRREIEIKPWLAAPAANPESDRPPAPIPLPPP